MKKIIVATDFSSSAHNAAIYALALAEEFDAELLLVHAYTAPVPAVEGGSRSILLAEEVRQQNEARLEEEKNKLKARSTVTITAHLLTGPKGSAIKELAEEEHADLIVTGRRITKENMLFGSTILKAIRKTNIPVLVVPENVDYSSLKRITMAVDFEEMIYRPSFDALFKLVKKFKADVSVLHVEKKEDAMTPTEVSAKLQLGVALGNVSYHYEKIQMDNITDGILWYVERYPTDMLVMIAHRHNFLERLFGNIHTASVTADVRLPLLILKNYTQ